MAKWSTGKARLRRVLKVLPDAQRKRLREAIAAGADEIVAAQRNLAPVSPHGTHGHPPGALRRSIVKTMGDEDAPKYAALRSKRATQDPELAAIISAGNSAVRYAHLVEWGTAPHTNQGEFKGSLNPGMHAEPFFYPGFRAHKSSVKRRINAAARQAIKDGLKTP